ncbi:FAD-dependent oxidoreductase [Sphingobacterium olei]|uniref:FAD-dependent oxidoreductase n=1 Tax=Sphingobacterium olei TaxID=2571155 RepID=A0A4U0P5X5_9SPHI|nr:FAD-dependent oxidoreductase [Sphingobacterium olei]TJZ62793.1 FAD-dependent oxidoreductase [Sphingobacterium olei]
MSIQNKGKIIIIGAGIAGLSSAFYLVNDGWQVEVLEQNDLGNSCSYGNAGMIVPSHFTPLAAPGVVTQGIRWMFDSKSPFYVKPTLASISWGLKFLKHSNQAHVDRSAANLRDLHLASSKLFNQWATLDGFDFELTQKGILMLFKTEKLGHEEAELAHTARGLGLDVDVLDQQATQALEPNAELDVLGAVHYKCDGHLYPQKLMANLIQYLQNKGVVIHTRHTVSEIEVANHQVKALVANDKKFAADKFVMTGGSWLPQLAKKAGLRVSLMPGKGYSFMHTPVDDSRGLIHSALLLEARVAVTPMNGQIRFGGTMELAPFNNKVNINRVEGIVRAVPDYLPDFKMDIPKVKNIWYGYRPCSPDGLPYLGATKKLDNLIIAGGTGMMGLSLGPIVGHTVAEIANEQKISVNISQYSPDRFQ